MRPTREEYIKRCASKIQAMNFSDIPPTERTIVLIEAIYKNYLSDQNSVESLETIPDTMKILTAKGKTIELDLIEIKYPTHSDRERQENDMRSYYRGDRDGAELFYRENNVSE